jgi:hypothetical protein
VTAFARPRHGVGQGLQRVVLLVRAVDRNGLLNVAEQFLGVDDVGVVLVGTVQPVRAADRLEQVVVTQFRD